MKCTQVSNSAIILVRNNGELYQSGNSGERGEKWSDPGYIINVETADFLHTVALMCESRKKGVQMTPRAVGQTPGRVEWRCERLWVGQAGGERPGVQCGARGV